MEKELHPLRNSIWLFLIFFLVVPNCLHAQKGGWYIFTHTSDLTSLSDDGNILWVGSNQGLVKVNKSTMESTVYNVVNSGLPTRLVTDIAADGKGGVWGTAPYAGIFHFDGTTWNVYHNLNTSVLKGNNPQHILVDHNGHVWVIYQDYGIDSSVFEYNGISWTEHHLGSPLRSLAVNGNGDILLGTFHDGFYTYDGSIWMHKTENDLGISNTTINCILEDSAGTTWLGTAASGILKYDGITVTSYTTGNSDIPSDYIASMYFDHEYQLWVGFTKSAGVSKFDGNWTTYTASNSGLISNYVNDIVVTADQTIWIASTQNGGLNSFDGTTTWQNVHISNSGLPANYISSMDVPEQKENPEIWMGTYSGLASFIGNTWTTFTTSNSNLVDNQIADIKFDRNKNLWIATLNGISLFDKANNSWTTYTSENTAGKIPDNYTQAIALDPDTTKNNVWIATSNGFAKFDGASWTGYSQSQNGFPGYPNSSSIVVDNDGIVWIGTRTEGVVKFDGVNWTIYSTTTSNLPSNSVSRLYNTPIGIVAITGYNNGISIYDPATDSWNVVNYSNSKLNNTVSALTPIPDFPTNGGGGAMNFTNGHGGSTPLHFRQNFIMGGDGRLSAERFVTLWNAPFYAQALRSWNVYIGNQYVDFSKIFVFPLVLSQLTTVYYIMLASSCGLFVNTSIPYPIEDEGISDTPDVVDVEIEKVNLPLKLDTSHFGQATIQFTPKEKGAFIGVDIAKNDGDQTDPNSPVVHAVIKGWLPNNSSDVNNQSLTFPFDFSQLLDQNTKEPPDSVITNVYVSKDTSTNGNAKKLVAKFKTKVSIVVDNAHGAVTDTPSPTLPPPPPTTLPDDIPITDIYRGGFPNLDLDNSTHPISATYAGDKNACVPTGVTNSLEWLASTYDDIELPKGKTPRDILEEVSASMKRADGEGVTSESLIRGDLDFIEKYDLPLEIKFQDHYLGNKNEITSTSGNSTARNFLGKDGAPDLEFLKQQLNDGEDVVLNYSWKGADGKTYAHCVSVTGFREFENGRAEIVYNSDQNQMGAGGTKQIAVEVMYAHYQGSMKLLMLNNSTDNIYGVYAESPKPTLLQRIGTFFNELCSKYIGGNTLGKMQTSDSGFVEIVITTSGVDLKKYRMSLYDAGGHLRDVKTLDQFTKGAVKDSFQVMYLYFPSTLLDSGAVSLTYSGTMLDSQFISFGKPITADSGDAMHLTSINIGTSPAGQSLHLTGTGSQYSDFNWAINASPSPGQFNQGQDILTWTGSREKSVPLVFTLYQNYPNPFNPSTTLGYTLPFASHVQLTVYNVLGQQVAVLVNREEQAGAHVIRFDPLRQLHISLSSGVYLYKIQARSLNGEEDFTQVRKMVLLK